MKSSVLLSEKESSVTPEPNALRGKSDLNDLRIMENKKIRKPLNSVDGQRKSSELDKSKRKASSMLMQRPEIRTRRSRITTA